MSIFNDIKEGILPDEKTLLYVYENDIKDLENKKQIENYIKILNNAYNDSTIEEKILLNRVIFLLELLINNEDSLKNFILKAFALNVHKIDNEYLDFLDELFLVSDEKQLFDIFNKLMKNVHKLPKDDLRSYFNWLLHKIWNMKKFHSSDKFLIFYSTLQKLLQELKKQNRVADMMYVEFFTYHIVGNNFQTISEWRDFNEKITSKTISIYEQFKSVLPKANPTKKKKKRIAFVKDRIVFNSPYQVEYSLFKNLLENKQFRDNYELFLYTFNQFEKNDDNESLMNNLRDLGMIVKNPVESFQSEQYYNNHLDKALTMRQALIDDEIDIMIGGAVYPIFNFLYVTRSAPTQIYYSHGNCAYDVPNIDKRISHFNQECPEFKWNIFSLSMAEEFLVGSEGEKMVSQIIKNDYKEKFGDDVVILGTIGRLVKIDSDEYIQTIAKIMEENPNTIYLACGDGNEESIKEKLKKYNIDEKRFIFVGIVKPHIYGWILDIWCDSFPLRAGQAKAEFKAKGGFLIEYIKNYFGKKLDNRLKEIELFKPLKFPHVFSSAEYIEVANQAIKDKEYRKKIGEIQKQSILKPQKTNFIEILKDNES